MQNITRWSLAMIMFTVELAAAPACNKPGAEQPSVGSKGTATTITAEARKEAEEIFSTRCMTCHGATGKGDGPASAGLTPKPRNFQDAAWQQSVSDEHIEKIIQYGGAAVGKSPAMPPNPDLSSKPQVVAGLRRHVRSLANPK